MNIFQKQSGRIHSQRGNFMVGMTIALLAASIYTIGLVRTNINSMNTTVGTVVGNQLQLVVTGLNSYITANSTGIAAGTVTGVAVATAPTVAELKTLGYLSSTINTTPTYGTAYVTTIAPTVTGCTSSCTYTGTVYLQNPVGTVESRSNGQNDIRVLQAASNASTTSQIGYSIPGSAATINGPGWSVTNPDPAQREGIVLARTTAISTTQKCAAWSNANLIDCTGDTQLLLNTAKNLVVMGTYAGASNTTGADNVFIGPYAGNSNVGGQQNVFTGSSAGRSNTTGGANIFTGYAAGYRNTTGGSNTFTGNSAGYSNTTGTHNVFNGYVAGFNNTTGFANIFTGNYAGYSNTTGTHNVFNGYVAGYSNTTGSNNIFTGNSAGYSNTTGSNNIFTGNSAGYSNTTGQGNIAIGHEANKTVSDLGLYNIVMGYQAGGGSTGPSGYGNVAIGYQAAYKWANTDGSGGGNVAIGHKSMYSNVNGYWNYAIGKNAMYSNVDGTGNIAIGQGALYKNISSGSNVAIGQAALSNMIGGGGNTAVGGDAMSWTTGNSGSFSNSTGIGSNALKAIAGSGNTAVGASAGSGSWWNPPASPGGSNSFFGYAAAQNITSGAQNTLLGTQVTQSVTTGSGNLVAGAFSGNNISSGNYNTLLGTSSNTSGDFTNAIAVGYGATATSSNTVRIGNTSITQIGGQVAWSNLSDRRLKTDIKNSERGLAFINQLRPVDYILKDNKKPETGFIAQEVEAVDSTFPGINKPANDKAFYSLAYTDFIPSLVKSVQELDQKLESKQSSLASHSDGTAINYLIGALAVLFAWNCYLQFSVSRLKRRVAANDEQFKKLA